MSIISKKSLETQKIRKNFIELTQQVKKADAEQLSEGVKGLVFVSLITVHPMWLNDCHTH